MAHSLTPAMLAQTQAQALMPIVFAELDTPDGNLYVWTGYGDIVWNSITWTGAGDFLGFDAVTETAQMQAAGFSISLSGVPSALVSLALSSLRRYLPLKMWLGALDQDFAVIADPYEIFNGRVDTGNITMGGDTSIIQVTAESRLLTMRQPRQRRYTDQDQRIEFPNDGGMKFVDFLQNTTIVWGAAPAP